MTKPSSAIDWLREKVKEGPSVDWEEYGDVKGVYSGDLVLFNYTRNAQFEGRWNNFERISRGLILNWRTGEVVARPFDKFFNWLERGQKASGHIVTITEKLDGSLGILYRHPSRGYSITTRGSFTSEQAEWATSFLIDHYDLADLPDEYTLLFEIVYPENRIVVEYDWHGLCLLAVRNRHTGEYLSFWPDVCELAHEYGFPTPMIYNFNSVEDVIAATDTLPGEMEGWVVEFSDGQRFKFKGDRYKELHRLVTNTSYKRVVDAIASGVYDTWIDGVPDEFTVQIREWAGEIKGDVDKMVEGIERAFVVAPKDDRKTFALWVMDNHKKIAPYLFRKLDGQEYVSLIYRREF